MTSRSALAPPPLRLTVDLDALAANWRWLARASGKAACGAAVKADAYHLGAPMVVERLAAEGARDFFVATWAEAAALLPSARGLRLHVLHGLRPEDLPFAIGAAGTQPVLNSLEQATLWREAAPGRPADLMVDSGMNRLGIEPAALFGLTSAADLEIDLLMSHLAAADEPESSQNRQQRDLFQSLFGVVRARRHSLANSAGICHGPDFHFELTRPGIGIYGGVQHPLAEEGLRQVVWPEAQVVQVRTVEAGGAIGYGATFVAPRSMRIAILNIGYADGYLRSFSNRGSARIDGLACPVVGRISMDLTAIDISRAEADRGARVQEGDWAAIDFDLARAARDSGLSQYELLTSLGPRYQRRYK